ncbi:MAG TPA: fused MFS/spermidine synthase [Gemmataceae bacterium]|nr:fused MFS/spermidine synthase [Gemmataceae bacterium]
MPRSGPMLLVYALTLFLSALLLFLVQPLIGKLITPLLGGFPAVWNTCVVFFQAMLLAGYAYAHYSGNWLGERKQAAAHLAVLLLPAVVLPLGVSTALLPAAGDNPIPGLLLLLLVSAGLPFFAIATTAPLLQRWFANTAHPAAKDPYFLYAASNAGSMLALLGYPSLVEPNLTLLQQRWAWSIGYGLLVLLLAGCAVLFWKSPAPRPPAPPKGKAPGKMPPPAPRAVATASSLRRLAAEFLGPSLGAKPLARPDSDLTLGRALRWVALAFVPSSLMLGATTYITTDIAAIPLLWVLPLTLYLLSFILVFSSLPALIHKFMVLALPVLLLLLVFLIVSKMPVRMWTVILLHLVVLFAVAMVCHGELARSRPAARSLTQFYLLMALGGVLGGLFNALLAPLIFTSTAEYPLALVFAALLMPRLDESEGPPAARTRWLDFLLPFTLGLICLEFFGLRSGRPFPACNQLLHLFENTPGEAARVVRARLQGLADRLDMERDTLVTILSFAPPIILSYVLVERPLRFGLGVAAVLFVSAVPMLFDTDHEVLYRDRSFFGVLNVQGDESDPKARVVVHRLLHGNTLHGVQFREWGPVPKASTCAPLASAHPWETAAYLLAGQYAWPTESPRDPVTYYHRTGPVGLLFAAFPGEAAKKNVAVIGLGTGTMAAYAGPKDHYTFYEIDRRVKEMSFDQKTYFSYVQDAKERGAEVDIVLGDARLSLERERHTQPEQRYDLIVVDAFSSDAIPVHLLTREALQIYRAKLKEDGLVAFHTSNRYLTLEPVIGNLAAAEEMACLMMSDEVRYNDKSPSTWVLVANHKADFGTLSEDPRWKRPDKRDVGVWTDDYSNLLSTYRWQGD